MRECRGLQGQGVRKLWVSIHEGCKIQYQSQARVSDSPDLSAV